MCDHAKNIYLPHLATITELRDETPDIRSLRLVFQDEQVRESFTFRAGQFAEYSAFGAGEATFCIASPPTRQGYIECCFRAVGRVTEALRALEVGETVGVRGPYGNSFPIEEFYGKNLVFVAGGIALPPLRTVIWNCLDLRERFGAITIVYGARTEADLVYQHELREWEERSDVTLVKPTLSWAVSTAASADLTAACAARFACTSLSSWFCAMARCSARGRSRLRSRSVLPSCACASPSWALACDRTASNGLGSISKRTCPRWTRAPSA